MREEVSKGYYVQETELSVLLAMKGMKELYGICLEGTESMTQMDVYHIVFGMLKKDLLQETDGQIKIEESLNICLDIIQKADYFLVFANTDELLPESYFYLSGDQAVLIQSAGQQASILRMEKILAKELPELLMAEGFVAVQKENMACPEELYEEAREFWTEDKDVILDKTKVSMLLLEYDIRTRCRTKQVIKFICGLDEYLICSDSKEDRLLTTDV